MEGAQCARGSSTGTQKPWEATAELGVWLQPHGPGPGSSSTASSDPHSAASTAGCSGMWFPAVGMGLHTSQEPARPPSAERPGTHTPKTHWDPRQLKPRGTRKGSGANPCRLPSADSAQDVAFHLTYIWWELWGGKGIRGVVSEE